MSFQFSDFQIRAIDALAAGQSGPTDDQGNYELRWRITATHT